MGGILLVFFVIAMLFMWGGVKVIGLARRKPLVADPPIPTARTVGEAGVDHRREPVEQRIERGAGKAGRALIFTLGLGLIAAPWIFAYVVISGFSGWGVSHGRALRVRKRARLPELARGDGWSGEPIVLRSALTAHERAVAGAHWLLAARTEHASVAAFSQLGLQLATLGAPAHLLEATHRAALDEIQHARTSYAIARALTGEAHTAGPIPALATRSGAIDLRELAIESLIDGCVGEGLAADVAARAAERAVDPGLRAALATIAHDESRHAELAWDVLAWALAEGGDAVHRGVSARVDRLGAEPSPRLPSIPGLDDPALGHLGIVDQATLDDLSRTRIADVRARAGLLLAPAVAREAA